MPRLVFKGAKEKCNNAVPAVRPISFQVGRQFKSHVDIGLWQRLVSICAVDPRLADSKSLVTLALLGTFGAFQGLLTYVTDLMVPD